MVILHSTSRILLRPVGDTVSDIVTGANPDVSGYHSKHPAWGNREMLES